MRAALLPMGGDPFLNAYWLRNFQTWVEHVDELRIVICDQHDPVIQEYLNKQLARFPNVIARYTHRTDHGEIIRQLINETSADTIMLCEDDAFVRKPEQIKNCFEAIERDSTDLIGCPRATGSREIIEWAQERFGNWFCPTTGESGPLLWPCFLFAKRSDLLRTDRHYGAWGRPAGTAVMNRTYVTDQAMDTFGWATLQLRGLGLKIDILPNYRVVPWNMAQWTDAPWFHVGSLSVGYGHFLLGHRTQEHLDQIATDPCDWSKRISWWCRVAEKWDGALPEIHKAYVEDLQPLINAVDPSWLERWKNGFDSLVCWNEL